MIVRQIIMASRMILKRYYDIIDYVNKSDF